MAGGACDEVLGSWYWIYYVGPFLASWFVAELTSLMDMDVGEVLDVPAAKTEEMEIMKDAQEVAPPAATDLEGQTA